MPFEVEKIIYIDRIVEVEKKEVDPAEHKDEKIESSEREPIIIERVVEVERIVEK